MLEGNGFKINLSRLIPGRVLSFIPPLPHLALFLLHFNDCVFEDRCSSLFYAVTVLVFILIIIIIIDLLLFSSQFRSPLRRRSFSLSLHFPAVRAPGRRSGNIPQPSQRETGASAKPPLRVLRTPPHLPRLLPRRWPSCPTWALVLPPERASPPISRLSAPAPRLTSARAAAPEAGVAR